MVTLVTTDADLAMDNVKLVLVLQPQTVHLAKKEDISIAEFACQNAQMENMKITEFALTVMHHALLVKEAQAKIALLVKLELSLKDLNVSKNAQEPKLVMKKPENANIVIQLVNLAKEKKKTNVPAVIQENS